MRERMGVQAGDRVLILAQNSIAYVDLLYAVGKIGAILAPLRTRLVARELGYIVNDCEPRVLFVGPEFALIANELRARTNIPHIVALENAPILTPMFHAGGLFVFLAPLLYAGECNVLTRAFDAEASLRLITDEKCTVILGVPTLFNVWQNTELFRDADFSRVRLFINGGAPCPPAIIEHWIATKQVAFRQGSGLTKVGTNCYAMTNEDGARKIGSVGKPIFHSEIRLWHPETGASVAQGEVGEWLIDNVGIRERHFMRDDQATSDLAAEAGRMALERAGIDARELDLVIISTDMPD